MEEQVKQKSALMDFLETLFGNGEFYKGNQIEEIKNPELIKSQKRADEMGKETTEAVVTENKSSKNGGFSNGKKLETKGINQETLNKMRENYNKTANKKEEDKEIEL